MSDLKREKIWTKSFMNIAASNFFLFSAFYALLTVLPVYIVNELNGTEAQAGLVVTGFLISAILVRPFCGLLLDYFGKKTILLISMTAFMVCCFIYLFVEGFYSLLALRFFHGIWFSLATTATGAIAADIVPIKRRGEGLGYFAMSMNIAVVVGPFIALTLIQYTNYKIMFTVFSFTMLGAIFFALLVHAPKTTERLKGQRVTLYDLFEKKALPIASVAMLTAFAYASIISFISIYAQSLGLMEAASYFFVIFAAAMLITRPFVGRMFDGKGPSYVIYPSLALFALGLVTLSLTHSSLTLFLAAILVGVGYGSLLPSLQTLAVQSADMKRSGHATATFFTLVDTGVASGSYVLGMIVTFFGYSKLYLTVGILVLVAMVLYKLLTMKIIVPVEEQTVQN